METAMSESPVKMKPREGYLADGKRRNPDEVESGDSKLFKVETEETNGSSINKTEVVAASKTEEAEPAISAEELDKRIIRQVEYYFGDYNLPKDNFMKEQIVLDDGWIPVANLLTFQCLADLTDSVSVICSALAKSTTGLLEIDEANKKVRRSKDKPLIELSDEGQEDLKSCSVYCKGFPRQSTTLDKAVEIEDAEEKEEPEIEDAGKFTLPRGTILKLINLPAGANCDNIKCGFADLLADIAHIEINEEDKTAFIRLRCEDDGKLVYGKLGENKSVKVLEETIQVVLLEGEEENDYLTKAEERVDAANKNLDIPLSTSTTDETSSDDEAAYGDMKYRAGNDKAAYSRSDIRDLAAVRPPVGTKKKPHDYAQYMKDHRHYREDFVKMCEVVAEEEDSRNKNKKLRTEKKK